jgi:hypothetical protein
MERSQNGWPASKNPEDIGVKSYPVKGTKIKLRLAKRAAPLLVAFAEEFHALVEPIDEGSLDDWGFAYRPIRGQTTGLSNHSSGTAIDLNSKIHILGKRNTFTAAQREVLDGLCKKYKLRGGYTYKNRPDDMHFEINCSQSEAAALIKELGLKEEK